jgi:hypothetical protein
MQWTVSGRAICPNNDDLEVASSHNYANKKSKKGLKKALNGFKRLKRRTEKCLKGFKKRITKQSYDFISGHRSA